jgi:hypothetical protein
LDVLRDVNVGDRDACIKNALQGPQEVRLWRLLSRRLTEQEKLAN